LKTVRVIVPRPVVITARLMVKLAHGNKKTPLEWKGNVARRITYSKFGTKETVQRQKSKSPML
jgi:hypothetical protein